MAWFLLIVAGLLEAGWAVGLKYTQGFTRFFPSVFTVVGIITSLYMLALAARSLPIGTAYSVWVGIGTLGAFILGMVFLGEPATVGRIFFLALLMISIIGLKLTS